MKRAFMISFDPLVTDVNVVHSTIINLPEIKEWWHYLSGTYVVTSEASLAEIRASIENSWQSGRYLLTELSGIADGRQPIESWAWLNTRVPNDLNKWISES